MSRRNQKGKQGVNIREMACNSSNSATRFEAYFESLPNPKQKSFFEKQEYIEIKAYLETDSSGYLLHPLDDVLEKLLPTFEETNTARPEKPLPEIKKRRTEDNKGAIIDNHTKYVENAAAQVTEPQDKVPSMGKFVMATEEANFEDKVDVVAEVIKCCCGCGITIPSTGREDPHTCTTTGKEVFGSFCFFDNDGTSHHKECNGCAVKRVQAAKKPNQLFGNTLMRTPVFVTNADDKKKGGIAAIAIDERTKRDEKIRSNLIEAQESAERLQKFKYSIIDPKTRKSAVFQFLSLAKYKTVSFGDPLHTSTLNRDLNLFTICTICCASKSTQNICEIVTPEGNTTNIVQHMQVYHKEIYAKYLDATKGKTAMSQLSIYTTNSNYDPKKDKSKTLVEMIVATCQPINFVENEYVRMHMTAIGLDTGGVTGMLSAKSLKESIKIRAKVLLDGCLPGFISKHALVLHGKQLGPLTTDTWTSDGNETYQSLSWSLCNVDFQLVVLAIELKQIEGRTTHSHIIARLNQLIAQWPLHPYSVTCDSEASMVKASRSAFFGFTFCVVHRLEKIYMVIDCEGILIKCRKLVTHFKHSTQASAHLLTLAKMLNVGSISLKQDCKTRWWSMVDMVTRLLQLQSPLEMFNKSLERIQDVPEIPNEMLLTKAEWGTLNDLSIIMEPLRIAERILEGDKYPTLGLVCPIIYEIRAHLKKCSEDGNDFSVMVRDTSSDMLVELDERFGNFDDIFPRAKTPYGNAKEIASKPVGFTVQQLAAGYLDLRNNLDWLRKEWSTDIKKLLIDITFNLVKYGDLGEDVRERRGDNIAVVKFVPPVVEGVEIEVQDQSNLQRRFPKGLNVSAATGTPILQTPRKTNDSDLLLKLSITTEVDTFESIGRYNNDYGLDISSLWRTIRDLGTCPNLCIMARYLFAIPATSATSERMFSEASFVCSREKAAMDSDLVQDFVTIKGVQKLRKQFPEHFNELF